MSVPIVLASLSVLALAAFMAHVFFNWEDEG